MESTVSNDERPRPFTWGRMSLLWKACGSVAALAVAVLTIVQLWPHQVKHAKIARVSLGERMTHAQYLASAQYVDVADQAHEPTAPYSPQAPGSVIYYTVDIAGHGFYHIRYQLWDKKHNPKTKAPVEVRALLVAGESLDPQAFWVPALSDVATVHLYVAPDNPPPLMFDWKDEAWN